MHGPISFFTVITISLVLSKSKGKGGEQGKKCDQSYGKRVRVWVGVETVPYYSYSCITIQVKIGQPIPFCYYYSVQCQSFALEARAIVGWFAPFGCARASLQRPSPLFSHLGTWCVLHSSISVHIPCSLSIVPFLIVSCLVVFSACVCVHLETAYCPCSVYNLQVGWTNSLVSFPHLQSPWCSVTQGPFQTPFLTHSLSHMMPAKMSDSMAQAHHSCEQLFYSLFKICTFTLIFIIYYQSRKYDTLQYDASGAYVLLVEFFLDKH